MRADPPDQVVDRMAAMVAEWDNQGDGRAVFLDCYLRMTRAVDAAIRDAVFADPEWVGVLLDRFAEYYWWSIDGGDQGKAIPGPWLMAHAAAVGHDASPLQLLLAGVNAHINFDLVLTLVDVLEPEWHELGELARDGRRGDYDAINQVIAATADQVQDLVIEKRSPMLELFDVGLGRLDERWAVRLLSGWRTRVWRQAIGVIEESDAARRQSRIGEIEQQCVRRARWLLI